MTRSHFIEILTVLIKYLFDLGVRLTEFSVTVESVTLRFYCSRSGQVNPFYPTYFVIPFSVLQASSDIFEISCVTKPTPQNFTLYLS